MIYSAWGGYKNLSTDIGLLSDWLDNSSDEVFMHRWVEYYCLRYYLQCQYVFSYNVMKI